MIETLGQYLMAKKPPKLVTINHDDYHAEHVGKTKDGKQFFLTTPFEPAMGKKPGCEFIALYLFDKAGVLLDAQIDSFGPRASLDQDARIARRDELLASLGDFSFKKIKIAPFEVERFGSTFGLIAQLTDDEDWQVIVEPGNYMCFSTPWNSGIYDT